MNPRQRGFLLLTSRLGNPDRKPLNSAQLWTLARRIRSSQPPREDRDLTAEDLIHLGYGRAMAEHVAGLLQDEDVLEYYTGRGKRLGCVPITRVDENYPGLLRRHLGQDGPGCLWARGDLTLLNTPAISLVGSRELREPNRAFAQAVGREAACQGLTLVSGNARGADRAAQDACLEAGGRVISVVADELCSRRAEPNLLYLSEEDYDAPFTAQRALSRNRVIHCLGSRVFAAQAEVGRGGTWDGTIKNLQQGWSPVAVFSDGSEAALKLEAMGAYAVGMENLKDLRSLCPNEMNFLNP